MCIRKAIHFSLIYRGNVKFVSIGSLDLNKVNASDQYQVVNQTKHPGYHPPSFYNDIGLLKLDRPVVFTNSIRPACLAVKETITDSQVYTSGWGQTSFGASLSATLQRVKLQIVSAEQCSRSYVADKRRLKYGIQSDMQICAGSPDNVKRDACKVNNEIFSFFIAVYFTTKVCTENSCCNLHAFALSIFFYLKLKI